MKLVCSTNGTVVHDYFNNGILDISSAGFEAVMLDMGMGFLETRRSSGIQAIKKFFGSEDEFEKYFLKLNNGFVSNSISVSLCRSPERKISGHESIYKTVLKCIDICSKIKCRYLSVPFISEISDAAEYYISLYRYAKEKNVIILIENRVRNFNGHIYRGVFSDSTDTAKFIDSINDTVGENYFGFCVNTAYLNACGQSMHEYINDLGSRTKAVIISECDGRGETFAAPYSLNVRGMCGTDWSMLAGSLRRAGFDGTVVLNIADTVSAYPVPLRSSVIKLAKETAEYILDRLDTEEKLNRSGRRVLFGAGNMFRNYMLIYGEKYPPEFVCDNNSGLWGKYVCGKEVRSPDALKEIGDEYGVYICNIYYRAIEEQLRNIGVKNIFVLSDNGGEMI